MAPYVVMARDASNTMHPHDISAIRLRMSPSRSPSIRGRSVSPLRDSIATTTIRSIRTTDVSNPTYPEYGKNTMKIAKNAITPMPRRWRGAYLYARATMNAARTRRVACVPKVSMRMYRGWSIATRSSIIPREDIARAEAAMTTTHAVVPRPRAAETMPLPKSFAPGTVRMRPMIIAAIDQVIWNFLGYRNKLLTQRTAHPLWISDSSSKHNIGNAIVGAVASYKAVFRRVEMKYILDPDQLSAVTDAMSGHMQLDSYGLTEIRNVYFDTPTFMLARRSNEHPLYKEKLRVRSYGEPGPDSEVFVELKKKYDGVVYKRRLTLSLDAAEGWLLHGTDPGFDSQIRDEIDYMMSYYGDLRPAMFLSYRREAYFPIDGGDLRLTLDRSIRADVEDRRLSGDHEGFPVLDDGLTLMELKIPTAIPLWMVEAMEGAGIRKCSFSKYGSAYLKLQSEGACGTPLIPRGPQIATSRSGIRDSHVHLGVPSIWKPVGPWKGRSI